MKSRKGTHTHTRLLVLFGYKLSPQCNLPRAARKINGLSDSSVLHCASLLRTIFASLACAHERVRVQNIRDFPQTKRDRNVNAPFLLNKDGDLYFSLHKNIEHIILFNFLKI